MNGPKHLWSGDWENESEEATTQIVRQPRPRDPEPAAPAPTPPPQRRRRRARPWVVPVAIAAVVIVGAAYGLTKVFGSSTPVSRSTATISPLPSSGSTRPVRWLGMEIITAPPGIALVETVQPNSNGDRAGLEPGDAILLIDNHPVGPSGSIASAIKGQHSGDHVTLEVNTGGTILQLVATLAAPPTPYP